MEAAKQTVRSGMHVSDSPTNFILIGSSAQGPEGSPEATGWSQMQIRVQCQQQSGGSQRAKGRLSGQTP